MLSVRNFYTTVRPSIFRLPSSIPNQFHFLQPRRPSQFPCFCYLDALTTTVKMPPSSAIKIAAEYAKSNRSVCKICSDKISGKSLRLGLARTNARGFESFTWHHLGCFPIDSVQIGSTENIKGLSSLKSADQETLKKLFEENNKSMEEVDVQVTDKGGDEDETEEHEKSSKKRSLEGTKEEVKDKNGEEDKDKTEEHEKSSKKIRLEGTKEDATGKNGEEDKDETKEPEKSSMKIRLEGTKEEATGKNGEEDKDETKEHEQSSKKLTTHVETELDIALSVADIKDKYRDAQLGPKWKAFKTIIFLERDDSLHDSNKIAAFDFDGCLANTSVRRHGADAWSLMYKSIPNKLQSLYNNGYKLVIFTNEANIDRWINRRQAAVNSKIGRLNQFIKRVNVPMQVFIACAVGKDNKKPEATKKPEDPFRKPKTGMWHIMEKYFNSGISIDMDQSFYVGDAAGRKNDHGDADLQFAKKLGLKFYLPEEYFDS